MNKNEVEEFLEKRKDQILESLTVTADYGKLMALQGRHKEVKELSEYISKLN